MSSAKDGFPFSAVVGQEEAQLALLLAAVDPAIGGVLLRGDKGSAKSTLARGLAGLLAGDAPFVELPIGATEDRVVGSLDLRAALTDGADRFRPGLLAAAHGGVLYVDEVNLLPDHLVDVLLDVAGSGINRVERDGVSHEHPARFLLLGSMNPEEGELRPQLLDRFGLTVDVRTSRDPALRAEAVRRRLAHDRGRSLTGGAVEPGPPHGTDAMLRQRLTVARPAALPDDVVAFAARLAVEVGAESLRADLVLCRAAAALAGWEDRPEASLDDVGRVAPLALTHRRRRGPFDPPTLPPDDLQAALDHARGDPAEGAGGRAGDGRGTGDRGGLGTSGHRSDGGGDTSGGDGGPRPDAGTAEAIEPAAGRRDPTSDGTSGTADILATGDPDADNPPHGGPIGSTTGAGSVRDDPGPLSDRSGAARETGRWSELAGATLTGGPAQPVMPSEGARRPTVRSTDGSGRSVGDQPIGESAAAAGLAVLPTVRAALQRRTADPAGPVLDTDDLRTPVRVRDQGRTVILVVDASGSMGTSARVQAATGAVLGLLADAYLSRDQVALVAFRGDEAVEVLPPTRSVELARSRLADLPTGGTTPLGAGIGVGAAVARRAAARGPVPLLVLLTDGRATGGPDALTQARAAASALAGSGIETVVLDAEDDRHRLGLAAELARVIGARYVRLADITGAAVGDAIRRRT
ncbi:MAG: ATP-binding protein [Acidimicrobiales bacterium]